MKLIRFGPPGKERPGVLSSDGATLDCSSVFADWDASFFRSGGLHELRNRMAASPDPFPLVEDTLRFGPCLARPSKIVCVGLNYLDHAKEAGMAIPTEPVVFLKSPSAICGPHDPILRPREASKLDWEVELGIVIGKDSSYLDSTQSALEAIAGFTLVNDVSERAFQIERGGQWTKGKSHDSFCPVGPWLVTPEEVGDFRALDLCTQINGVVRQTGNTKLMIFDVPFLIQYLSQFMTLEAGDLVLTGTPPGVAFGMAEPAWLVAGDVVEVSISHLGAQRQEVVQR